MLAWILSNKTKQEIASVDEDVEQRKSLCTAGRNVNWCSHYGNSMEVPQKIKNKTTI